MPTVDSAAVPGLLLTRAAPSKVSPWVRRGTVPAYVLPLGGWSAVVPAGPSRAEAPYDDAATVLASRPVPNALRTALGFFVMDQPQKAVVVLRPAGARSTTRWLTWIPGRGALEVPDHAPINVRDLLHAAGLADSERHGALSVLARREGAALGVLVDLLKSLGLPGADLLTSGRVALREDAVLVTPDPRRVARFDRDVAESKDPHAEPEEEGQS